MAITVKEAQTLYVSYFGRPADFAGLQYWTGNETLVGSLEQLAHSFFNSAEGKKYYPVDPATNQIDITASINAIYANMFGRAPETAGFDYWYKEIASGKINPAEAAVAIYKGAQGKDALMVENKIAAATQFTDQVAASGNPSLYNGDQAFAKANEFLNTVTDTTDVTSAGFAAQVNAAVAAAEAAGGSSSEGGTFMLTAGVDYADNTKSTHDDVLDPNGFKFTNGDDKVTADVTTLTAGDILVDLSATDNDILTLNFGIADVSKTIGTSASGIGSGAKIVGIEELDIVSAGATNVSFDDSLVGFKTLKASGTFFDATGSGFTFTAAAANTTLSTVDASGITAGTVKLDATSATQDLTIIGSSTVANVINGGKANTTMTGGSGKDTITSKADAATDINVITGGAGDDTIDLTDVGSGADTIMFEATAAANGFDTIKKFAVGAGKDVLNFSAFLGKTKAIAADVAINDIKTGYTHAGDGNVIILKDSTSSTAKTALTASDFLVNQPVAGAQQIAIASGKDYVVGFDDGTDTTLYYVDLTGTTITSVTKVAVLDATSGTAFGVTNFA